MRKDHLRGTVAVAVDRARVTADHIEETVDLALRMMEPTGTRPTIGTAVDCRIAVGGADPVEFPGDQRDRLRPVDRDEGLEATELTAGPMTFRKIGCPDHRAQYPRRALHRVDDRASDGRWRRIIVEWVKANQDVAIVSCDISAPMGREEPSLRNRDHASSPRKLEHGGIGRPARPGLPDTCF